MPVVKEWSEYGRMERIFSIIGMLTTVVGIPKAYGFTTTPARITGSIGSTPLRDTILLSSRNNLEVLLHDELIVFCHRFMLSFGHILCLNTGIILIYITHIKF